MYLRERPEGASLAERIHQIRSTPSAARGRLSYRRLAAQHGPSREDLDAVQAFALRHRLVPGAVNATSCSIEVTGRVADLEQAFGVRLAEHSQPHVAIGGRVPTHRGPGGPVSIPPSLDSLVVAVAGLSDRPLARTHFLLAAPDPVLSASGHSATAVARAYGVPGGASAEGQTIGVIALGGGYTRRDLAAFCADPSVDVGLPQTTDISVHGAVNRPTNGGDPATADGEVALDMETIAAVAPGAAMRVYFAPNTDRGFIDSVARSIRDGCTVITISWGAPEMLWPFSSMIAFDRTCQAAVAMGIPIFCAAGDNGSTDGLPDSRSHADFPASSPHTVACGGTVLPGLDRLQETAWNDLGDGGGAGGGAVSDAWPMPDFQSTARPPVSVNDGRRRRTVPDLAANAAPRTGYRVMVGGRWYVFGGTSAVAPLMAGMTALINAEMDRHRRGARLGDFHALLYSRFAPGGAMHDIADGSSNGGQYFARTGYDAVTGWGSPDYQRMLDLCIEDLGVTAARRRLTTRPWGLRSL